MMKIYFGYDESNNGEIPEFHIITFTQNNSYVNEFSKKKDFFEKGKKRNETFDKIFENNDWDYKIIVLHKDMIEKLSNIDSTKLTLLKNMLVVYSFFDSINLGNFKGDFFIDGIMDKKSRKLFSKLIKLYCSNSPKFLIKGDQKMELINFADRIAYQFLNEFRINGSNFFKKTDSLISLNWKKQIYPKFDHKFNIFLSELGFKID